MIKHLGKTFLDIYVKLFYIVDGVYMFFLFQLQGMEEKIYLL